MITQTRLSDQQTTTWENIHNIPVFKTPKDFSLHIENIAAKHNMTHMEAVLYFCEQHMVEPSDISSKINKSLKDKISQDARDLNFLPKKPTIDF